MYKKSVQNACLLVCVLLLVSACVPKKTIVSKSPDVKLETAPPAASSMVDKADQAWNSGNMLEAERLYSLAVRDPRTASVQKAQAWERLSRAALANRHSYSALDALAAWGKEVPGAETGPAWQELWAQSLAQLPATDAVRRSEALWRDTSRHPSVRSMGAMFLLSKGRQDTIPELGALYKASDTANRAAMEKRLFGMMSQMGDSELGALTSNLQGAQEREFPWSVFMLESARRANVHNPEAAKAIIDRLNAAKTFADPALSGAATSGVAALPDPEDMTGSQVSYHAVCMALIVPLSGPFETVGQRVSAGAEVARSQLGAGGVQASVHILDSESPDWINKLNALSPECVTVGGPLRPDAFSQAKAAGLTAGKAFFTFLPRMDEGDEGRLAWRFFASREDQVRALLGFSAQFGVNSFASYHPEDDFGRYMNELFVRLARGQGASVQEASYPPQDPPKWTRISGSLVGVQMAGKVPVPTSSFQAVFLPDSWASMDMLVGTLFYQGEDRLLLLGTSLWEQALSEGKNLALTNMGLAAFPSAWSPNNPSAAARALVGGLGSVKADSWSALGYDFVRFASAMKLGPGWNAAQVNSRIDAAKHMRYAMGPLDWQNGVARQTLFMLTPTPEGPVAVDVPVFQKRLDEVRAKHARRVSRSRGSQ